MRVVILLNYVGPCGDLTLFLILEIVHITYTSIKHLLHFIIGNNRLMS